MTTEQTPEIDVFLAKERGAWRLYVARPFCPLMLRDHLDEHWEAFPVAEPDLDDLERHMWNTDSPYEKRTATHGVQIVARGRSAVSFAVWLEGLCTTEND